MAKNIVEKEPSNALKEVKIKNSDLSRTMLSRSIDASIWPESFSSWTRLTRTQAWVMRFMSNCHISKNERLSDNELTSEEITDAESHIVKLMQQEIFYEKCSALIRKNKLLKLCPRLDDNGIIRADGRLKYAEFLPYNTRYPIVLPRKNWVTKLIIKHHHELGGHSMGTNQTLSSLSSKYWILAAREAIIEWERECGVCRKQKARNSVQIMAPLPLNRLQTSLRAFTKSAVDFAGPFVTVQGRGKRREKRYFCLFTCLALRTVHLEIVFGLDVDSFLGAFYRMTNRRGLPEEIISDNGTNFVAAEKELRDS